MIYKLENNRPLSVVKGTVLCSDEMTHVTALGDLSYPKRVLRADRYLKKKDGPLLWSFTTYTNSTGGGIPM